MYTVNLCRLNASGNKVTKLNLKWKACFGDYLSNGIEAVVEEPEMKKKATWKRKKKHKGRKQCKVSSVKERRNIDRDNVKKK